MKKWRMLLLALLLALLCGCAASGLCAGGIAAADPIYLT